MAETKSFIEAQIKRNNHTNGFKACGNLNAINDHSVTNVAGSVFAKGDVIDLSQLSVDVIFEQEFKGRNGGKPTHAYLMVVAVENNGGTPQGKNLYFSTLTKSVAEYKKVDDQPVQTGNGVSANNAFYNEMLECATYGEQFEKLQKAGQEGKKLYVTEVLSVVTARYREDQVVGTRNAQVPVFELKL